MVKAQETNLERVLEGTRQYQVPLYQRVYSWDRPQLDQLWLDLLDVVEARKKDPAATHFMGSLVLAVSPETGAVGIQKFLVVDGQQRLTTLTILLAALRDHQAAIEGSRHRDRIDTQFLINKYELGEPLKLVPTQADRVSYAAVIRATPTAGGEGRIGDAYRRFRAKLAEIDHLFDLRDMAAMENAVLRGLAVVVVTAEPGDNAHRIFESLNNTGLQLTQADLLKNYLFMRLGDRAEPVYDSIWLPLEQSLDSESLELLFWLDLVQRDENAKQSDTYVGQQRRLERLAASEIEAEVSRIAQLGDLLAIVLDPARELHAGVRLRLERIRSWGSTTAYPVVMQLLSQRQSGRLTDGQVEDALLCLESYFVRRIVIGRATAGLNRSLLQATGAIANSLQPDTALRTYLSTGRRHFGTDVQVREAANSVAFYWQGRAAQKKLILLWLEESFGSKEQVAPHRLTIEHVLPQTLTSQIRAELAAQLPEGADVVYEHERVVHTLGNLTLTGYNSELGNLPYGRKREMLAKSGIRLNQGIVSREQWGVPEIRERGALLAERIIELWPGPDESLLVGRTDEFELRGLVASVVAEVPAGRWTSYGEVAVVTGSHPVAIGTVLANHRIPNAWRVLQTGGTISPQFRWSDPERTEQPRAVLEAEGLEFDETGRALSERFVTAPELAALAGLDVDAIDANGHRRSSRGAARDPSPLQLRQQQFWNRVREWGQRYGHYVREWRPVRPRHWYRIGAKNGASVELSVNSEEKWVATELYVHDNKDLFYQLRSQRETIESELGLELEWREMPDRKASRIVVRLPGDFRDESMVPGLVEWLGGRADDFVRVFYKFL